MLKNALILVSAFFLPDDLARCIPTHVEWFALAVDQIGRLLAGAPTAALSAHSFKCFMILGPTSAISAEQAATTDRPTGSVLSCATPPINTGPNSKPK